MRIIRTGQDRGRPPGIPPIIDPVKVTLDCEVFYDTGNGLKSLTGKPIFCEWRFATTVLTALEQKCMKYGYGLVHVGVYAPRFARRPNGKPILVGGKPRVSGHNGRAIDWKGLVLPTGQYMDMLDLRANSPVMLKEITDYCRHLMKAARLRPEIVVEPSWLHCGYYP